ncbi:MAG: hypothetical protein ABIN61_00845 [candidate division WOR-3 bacterium]
MKIRLTQWFILFLLLIGIFHPVFLFKKKVPIYGVLLFDRSESMKGAKDVEIVSQYPLKKVYFGEGREGTDIGEALLDVKRKYEEARFIILYSDGSNTKGENPVEVAARLGIPVYFLIPEFDKGVSGFISVYGPSSSTFGDSVKLTLYYYNVEPKALLEINYNGTIERKEVRKEGIFDFSFFPFVGENNIEIFLLSGKDTVDKVSWTVKVKDKKKLLIVEEVPYWNHKFIKRYFEDKTWKVEEGRNFKIDNDKYDIICILEDPSKYIEEIERYLGKGGNVIIVSEVPVELNFLPVIAGNLSKSSGKLPESFCIKPGGIKRASKEIEVEGEIVGYKMLFKRGMVIQFTYLELWRLAILGGLQEENLFRKVMDNLVRELIEEEPNFSYSKKILEGDDFILRFNKPLEGVYSFFWDGKKKLLGGDSVIVKSLKRGKHYFKVEYDGGVMEDEIEVVERKKDKIGIDTFLLSGIGKVSGGGEWKGEVKMEDFMFKEREILINLRHNWFFISFLILLLFFDWFLWLKEKS